MKLMKNARFAVLAVAAAALMGAACSHPSAPQQNQSPSAQPTTTPTAATQPPAAASAGLMAPETLTAKAPETFNVHFVTTKGDFVVQAHRSWAPNGVDRFYNAVKAGYYDGDSFFRVVKGFMVQFGINPDPAVNAKWRDARIQDDPVAQSNKRGMVTFAMAGPNTRTTQLFINYGDNAGLDGQGFAPIGQVTSGMETVDALYGGYGDGAPYGQGPDQGRVQTEGATYLHASFPQLDEIKTARVE